MEFKEKCKRNYIKNGKFGGVYSVDACIYENTDNELKTAIQNYTLSEDEKDFICIENDIYKVIKVLSDTDTLCIDSQGEYKIISSSYIELGKKRYFIHKLNTEFKVVENAYKQFQAIRSSNVLDATQVFNLITNDYEYSKKQCIIGESVVVLSGKEFYENLFEYNKDGDFVSDVSGIESIGSLEIFLDELLKERVSDELLRVSYLEMLMHPTRYSPNSNLLYDFISVNTQIYK